MAGMQVEDQQVPHTPAASAAHHQNQHIITQQDTAADPSAPCVVPGGGGGGPTLRRRALDLRRLLHAMRTSTSTSTSTPNNSSSDGADHRHLLPSYIIADRLALSQSLLSHLHHTITRVRQARIDNLNRLTQSAENEHLNVEYERRMAEVEEMRREHIDRCVQGDGLVQSLTVEVEEVSRLAREDLMEARRREREEAAAANGGIVVGGGDFDGYALEHSEGPERDIIDELFLSPDDDYDAYEENNAKDAGEATDTAANGDGVADDYSLGLSEDGNDNDGNYPQQQQPSQGRQSHSHDRQSPRAHHHHHASHGKTTDEQNEELKRQQAEMLESEIAEMASQMKSATLRMNTTLREQSNALDDMEQTVTENLDQVTDVTAKVTDHVSRGWKKTAATWTLLFSIVGTFAFLFMTMRVAPKRRDACIFFCDSRYYSNAADRRRSSEYEAKWNKAEEERKRLMEELRLRDEGDAAAAAAEVGASSAGEADQHDDEDTAVCETLADGTVQCFGRKDRRKKAAVRPDAGHEDEGGCSGGDEAITIEKDVVDHPVEQKPSRGTLEPDPENESRDDHDSDDQNQVPDEVEEEIITSDEERQRMEEEARQRMAEDAKRRAIRAKIDEERQRDAIEMMERDKKNRQKEDDRMYAEAFKAYSQYKKQTREDLAEQKRIRDQRIEQEEKERQEKEERLRAERIERERVAAEEKAAQERKLEEERLRQEKEAAEAQARADKKREEEEQKKKKAQEQERIAAEKSAAEEASRSIYIGEQDFRFAAAQGRLKDVQAFINRYPDKINSPDSNRWTALHESARAGQTDVIRSLLDAGADPSLTTNMGQDALQLLVGTHGSKHPGASLLRQYKSGPNNEQRENSARSEL